MDANQIQEQYAKAEQLQLAEEMRWRRRLDAYRSVFEKVDRILSGKVVDVSISGSGQVPPSNTAVGWTDGETIWLNGPRLASDLQALQGKDITQQVIALKGVNYHELAHVLYSPRMQDEICKKVIERAQADADQNWWHALNILEDQRAETLYASRYRPAIRYFEAIALKWLVQNQDTLSQAHILVRGRKFLPKEVRRTSREAFTLKYGKALQAKASRIIDDYLTLLFPADTLKGFKLVAELRAILDKMGMQGQIPHLVISGHIVAIPWNGKSSGGMKKGRATVKDQKKAQEARAAREGDMVPDEDSDDAGPGADEQATPGKNLAGQGGDEPATDQHQDNPTELGDDLGQSDAPTGDEPGGGLSTGPSGANPWDTDEAAKKALEAMQEALDKALDNDDFKHDIDETIKAIRVATGDDQDPQGSRASFAPSPATDEARGLISRMVHALSDLKLDLEPTWHRRETQGRVNMRRILLHQDHELDVFDRWDEGSEDEGGVEVVVLIDQSSSMGWQMDRASEALWVLKRAFDELDIRTTVIGYNDSHRILMYGDEVIEKGAVRLYGSSGSTDPSSALSEAYGVLAGSSEANKVLVTITDGQWLSNDHRCTGAVRAIHSIGGTTLLLGLDKAKERYGAHSHEFAMDLERISDLPSIATKLVAGILSKVAARS